MRLVAICLTLLASLASFAQSVRAPIATGDTPRAVAVNPVTNTAYVINEFGNNVSVVDGSSGAVKATVPVGNRPEYIAVNPQTNRIYVSQGDASLTVIDGSTIALDYTIDGVTGHKRIVRQLFAPQEPTALPADFADMWWGGSAQNGWGIAWLQQYRTLFGVWFTYDASGAPTWFVMPSGFWSDASTYEGRLYRTSGSAYQGVYDPSRFASQAVGSIELSFGQGTATARISVEGRVIEKPLVRMQL